MSPHGQRTLRNFHSFVTMYGDRDTISSGYSVQEIQLFQRFTSRFWVEEVDDRDETSVENHENEIKSPSEILYSNWRDLHDGKVPDPVGSGGKSGTFSSETQFVDFSGI